MNYALHIKILYGLIVVLLVALISMNVAGRSSQNGSLFALRQNQTGTVAATAQPNLSNIVIGGGGPSTQSVLGTITEIDGATMKVKAADGSIATILTGANTTFQIGGPSKDQATIQKELAAYNAQITNLLKDPVKNKAALAALHTPLTQITYPATITDFKIGDKVLVVASSINASGAYVVTILTRS